METTAFARRQIRRLARLYTYVTMFSGWRDIQIYRALVNATSQSSEMAILRMRQCHAIPMVCRRGTTDVDTIWETFYHQFHLPNIPLTNATCVVDLGANVGYTAAHFACLYPRARIIAVEMDASNTEICAQNLSHFGHRCEVMRAAVWSKGGLEVEYSGTDANAFSLVPSRGNSEKLRKSVRTATLEEIFAQYKISNVDYLKVDIEGAEAEVLSGPMEWSRYVRALGVEIHPPATYEECKRALEGKGFKCQTHHKRPGALFAYK